MRPPETAHRQRLWRGVSVYDDLEHARAQARSLGLGDHVAVLMWSEEAGIEIAKTTRDPFHFTLWGSPERLLALVDSVLPVDGSDPGG